MEKCQEKWQKTKLKFGGAGTGEIRGYLGLSHAPHPQVAAPGERSGEAGGEQTPSPNETGSVSPGKGGGGRQGEGGRKERKEIPMNLLKRGTAGRAGGIRDLHFQSEVLKPGEAFGLPPLRQMTFFYSLGGFNAG